MEEERVGRMKSMELSVRLSGVQRALQEYEITGGTGQPLTNTDLTSLQSIESLDCDINRIKIEPTPCIELSKLDQNFGIQ